MMRIQNAYVRYRNRRSRLDGPLLRGRFGSRPVQTMRYWLTLLRYIANNANEAGLCRHPFEHPYSSARHFVGARSPAWFDRQGVGRKLRDLGLSGNAQQQFAHMLGLPLSDGEAKLIERRMTHGLAKDALDELFRAAPAYVARWMARKIRDAGGASPWTPVAASPAVVAALDQLERNEGAWSLRIGKKPHDCWSLLAAGLLHSLACLTTDAIGTRLGCHGATASRRIKLHKHLMIENPEYARTAGQAARAAIDRTFTR